MPATMKAWNIPALIQDKFKSCCVQHSAIKFNVLKLNGAGVTEPLECIYTPLTIHE